MIKIKQANEWYKINVKLNCNLPAAILLAKETQEIKINRENDYVILSKETYKILKEISEKDTGRKANTFNVAAQLLLISNLLKNYIKV